MVQKRLISTSGISVLALMLMASVLISASGSARANVVTELPTDLGVALGVSTNLAGMILSMGILVGLVLVLAVAKMPPIGIVLALVSVMILLTVMTWLDQLVLIFTGIISSIYFAMTVKDLWG